MNIIGLTGGIGSGKSTVAKQLAAAGIAVVDADVVAREVVEPGQPALDALQSRFGEGIIGTDGRLDRAALGAIAFSSEQARRDLEAITHPAIAAATAAKFAALRDKGASVVVYEAPVLLEAGRRDLVDGLVVVTAPRAIQIERVVARGGLTAEQAAARIDAQMPQDEKAALADIVIDNAGELPALRAQVSALIDRVRAGWPSEDEAMSEALRPIVDPGPTLVTGYPGIVARAVVERLVARGDDLRVLVSSEMADAARRHLHAEWIRHGRPGPEPRVLEGWLPGIDWGLTGAEIHALLAEVRTVYHLVDVEDWLASPDTIRDEVSTGTRELLVVLQAAKKLRGTIVLSSAFAAGRQTSVVSESALDHEASPRTPFERARFHAESLVRAAEWCTPSIVVRPSLLTGPYGLAARPTSAKEANAPQPPFANLVRLVGAWSTGVALPVPGDGEVPFHWVPTDHVADFLVHVGSTDEYWGRTFNVTAPDPPTVSEALAVVAAELGKPPPRPTGVSPKLAGFLVNLPVVRRMNRAPQEFVNLVTHLALFERAGAEEVERRAGLSWSEFADAARISVKDVGLFEGDHSSAEELADDSGRLDLRQGHSTEDLGDGSQPIDLG